MDSATAFAPATIANIGFGYDILGMAIEAPGDYVTISFRDDKKITIESVSDSDIPLDINKNTAGVAVLEFLKHYNTDKGFNIKFKKGCSIGSGMGSSAATAAAALTAINFLLGSPFKKEELIPFGIEAEKAACGSAHGDNIAPSILGGIVLIREKKVTLLPKWENLSYIVIHPDIILNTRDSRAVLPKEISLKDGVKQWGNIAALITAVATQNKELLKDVFSEKELIEYYRHKQIPFYNEMKKIALKEGVLGFNISGSGPSVFALTDNLNQGKTVGEKIELFLKEKGIKSDYYYGYLNTQGAKIINEVL